MSRHSDKKKRKHSARKRIPRRFSRFRKSLITLVLLCLGLAGLDYYDAGNLDRTLTVLETAGTYLQEVPKQAEGLEKKARALTEQLLYGKVENYTSLEEIPAYSGQSYVTINNNVPFFTEEQRTAGAYEYYSELDWLGRCGYAEANISPALMPTEERGEIGSVKPTGWHTVKYEGIDGNYLYNRCHLLGYQLTGENANERNLITGTRYMNVEGMLPWENLVAEYIEKTGDTVMYRVTPYFEGENLVATGVQMEAESMGSNELRFHVFVFNVQPGIGIDYATGDSWKEQ